MKLRTAILMGLAGGTAYLALANNRKRPIIDLRGKIVLITGGSRGLGMAMARELGSRGAAVAICARDAAELERAKADLSSRGVRCHSFVCDIAEQSQVNAMVAEIEAKMGPIDFLVNNAGVIKVGPFAEMDTADFEQAMNVIFRGTLYSTLAVLPAMRERRRGNIVNITSIGGKVSVPHLLPYSCAKFAVVALSEGLRSELAPDGIRVTTIVPGLLRTGSHLNAEFKGRKAQEYAWFAAGAATPFVSIGADRAAQSIVQAMVRGDSEKVLSIPAEVLARLQGLAPGLTSDLLSLANRLLPMENSGLANGDSRFGHNVEAGIHSWIWKVLTAPGRRAAESLNEIPGNPEGALAAARR